MQQLPEEHQKRPPMRQGLMIDRFNNFVKETEKAIGLTNTPMNPEGICYALSFVFIDYYRQGRKEDIYSKLALG